MHTCNGVPTLLIEFSAGKPNVTVTTDGSRIEVELAGRTCELNRATAAELQTALEDALTERKEFFRTAGEYRADGSYEVSRRCADSAGNSKVFDSFENLRRLYDRLPREFTADDVGRTGITGSRRHMLIRHFTEHPGFDCEIETRNPLTGKKSVENESGDTH